MYNLQFHLLRAWDSEPLPTPVNSRQGARSFDHLNTILAAMEAKPELVGGLRMEIRLRFNHFIDAVNHAILNAILLHLTSEPPTRPLRLWNTLYTQEDYSAVHGVYSLLTVL